MLSLKKVCSLGLAAALVATGLMTTAANAADGDTATDTSGSTTTGSTTTDTDTQKTSTATFTVNPDGKLLLDSVPTFTFGTMNATDLLKGDGALDLTNDSEDNQIKVTDTTGHGNGYWQLNAKLATPFTNTNTKRVLPDATLALKLLRGTNAIATKAAGTQAEGVDLTSAAGSQTVITKGSAYPGVSTYPYTTTSATTGGASANLSFPATSSFDSGEYDGTVTWNLSVAP